ncbi:hypothetical protein LTR37_009912 [Vermiconidia calcicola]|uniref:Uncharacterized protein n=1 Tax=Vermiconidia calcicola TaxID=1690605 RepID=A0ACC3N6Z1_9PEZI|nr:hypothetical protein LTR37_009912 [Vermiconidia calcicola]
MDSKDIEALCEAAIAYACRDSEQTKLAPSNDLNATQATSSIKPSKPSQANLEQRQLSVAPSAKLSNEEKPSTEVNDVPESIFAQPISSSRRYGKLKDTSKAPTGSKRKLSGKLGRASGSTLIDSDLDSDAPMTKIAKRKAKTLPKQTEEVINLVSDNDAEVTTPTNPVIEILAEMVAPNAKVPDGGWFAQSDLPAAAGDPDDDWSDTDDESSDTDEEI